MSRIVFHKIEFQNFMSYGNYISSIELDKNKLTLIQGENGVGKTTALLALSYNLFGKTFNKAVKSSLINKKNKKGLLTRSWFSIGENNYFIERGEKPSIFRVEMNGQEIEIDGDSREFQKKLESEILQFDLKTFTRLICLGYNYIRFFELSTPERREFIESVLDLGSLADMSKQIKEFQKTDSDSLVRYELMLNGKRSNKEIYEKQLETLSKDNENIIKTNKAKLNDLIKENQNIKEKVLEIKSNMEDYSSKIKDIQKTVNDNQERLNKAKNEAVKNNTLISNNNSMIEFLNNHDNCPTCKQSIDINFKKNQIDSLTEQNNKLNKNNSELKGLANGIIEVISNFNDELKILNEKYVSLNSEISGYKTKFQSNDIIIKETENIIKNAENNGNINDVKKEIELAIKDISDFENKIEVLKLKLDIYKSTLEILSETGVKKALINNYIDIINAKVNEYLEDFGCSFDFIMDNEFNETINLDFHDDVKYENLSAGQKQRLDLSIFLAFREIAQLRSKSSANILLLDEILDTNLDDDGVCKIIDILGKQDKINILAISHNSTCKELFENVITIRKKKYGFSEIC